MSLPARSGTWRSATAPDRVALRHVGALDDDAVGVLQVLLERRRATAAERDPQTGDRGAVSDPRLVLHLHDAERGVELLEEVVLLVVDRGAAEVRDGERPADRLAMALRLRIVDALLPRGVPRPLHALRDHLHRLLERDGLPARASRP